MSPSETATDRRARGPIALDGPVASGKSTVGRRVADTLGWPFIDTGLMYRAVGYLAEVNQISLSEPVALARVAEEAAIRVDGAHVTAGGREIGDRLHTPEVAQAASRVAELPEVRRVLVARQRQLAADAAGTVVMVGRDICTVVLPNAPVKVYLDAPSEERARRRVLDEAGRGRETTYDVVLRDLQSRDQRDRERDVSPLHPAPDATTIQTGGMTIDQVVEAVLNLAAHE